MSEEDLKKIKDNKPNFKIGFSEDTAVQAQERRQRGTRGNFTNEIDLAPGDPAQQDRNAGQGRMRQKNKDENPQEFEEVGSQEEQSEERAIEYVNQI